MMSASDILSDQLIREAFENAEAVLTKGVSVAQAQEIDPEKIEALYALGHRSYMRRDYQKAEQIFAFAYRFDHRHFLIVKGLASSRKMQGKFKEALPVYAQAALLDLEDPTISFHAGECLFALGDAEPCRKALEAARELANMQGGFDLMIKKIDQMEEQLEKQEKGNQNDK